MPDDRWLTQTAGPLMGSIDPSSNKLPEELTKIATSYVEIRNGSKLHPYETQTLEQHIRKRVPMLDLSAYRRAGEAEEPHTDALHGLLEYWGGVVDHGNTEASAYDAPALPHFQDAADLGKFLCENGALDPMDGDDDGLTSQTVDTEVGLPIWCRMSRGCRPSASGGEDSPLTSGVDHRQGESPFSVCGYHHHG